MRVDCIVSVFAKRACIPVEVGVRFVTGIVEYMYPS